MNRPSPDAASIAAASIPETAPKTPGRETSEGRAMTRLALLVVNRPGVMARVMNLFARRACNVEGILCLPGDDGTSRVWLTLAPDAGGATEGGRLEVLLRQVRQLQDVFEAREGGADGAALTRVARTFGS